MKRTVELSKSQQLQGKALVGGLFMIVLLNYLGHEPFLVWVFALLFALLTLLGEWYNWTTGVKKTLVTLLLGLVVVLGFFVAGNDGALAALGVFFAGWFFEAVAIDLGVLDLHLT